LKEDRLSEVELKAKQRHLEEDRQRQVDLEDEKQRNLEEYDPDQRCEHSERK
jgi:hypothetical protein